MSHCSPVYEGRFLQHFGIKQNLHRKSVGAYGRKTELGLFLCSVSLSGAFYRLPARTIGFCVHGLRNAVRWQGSGIAAW